MTTRTYPYTAWVLQPSFKPKQVELTGPYDTWGDNDYGAVTAAGKVYAFRDTYSSKAAAIEAGWESVARQDVDLEKKRANLEKKRAALVAAEAHHAT